MFIVMENNFECTCWDVNAEGCEFHRLMELYGCDYDWDNVYEECGDEVSQRDIDVILSDADDELPF